MSFARAISSSWLGYGHSEWASNHSLIGTLAFLLFGREAARAVTLVVLPLNVVGVSAFSEFWACLVVNINLLVISGVSCRYDSSCAISKLLSILKVSLVE